ncbi:unnamed protein product [Caenorhabditis brenneri]
MFTLFLLPFLALEVVLDVMDRTDLIRLAWCSKTTRTLLKLCRNEAIWYKMSDKLLNEFNALDKLELYRLFKLEDAGNEIGVDHVDVKVSTDARFDIKLKKKVENDNVLKEMKFTFYIESIEKKNDFEGKRCVLQLDGEEIPAIMTPKDTVHTFWEDTVFGFTSFYKYAFENQTTPNIYFETIANSPDPKYSRMIKTAVDCIGSLGALCMIENMGSISEEDFHYVVNASNALFHWFTGEREVSFQSTFKLKGIWLFITESSWVTIENLFCMGHELITLTSSSMTNKNVVQIIKHWISGGFSKLETLNIELAEDLNIGMIFNEIQKLHSAHKCSRSKLNCTQTNETIRVTRSNHCVAEIVTKPEEKYVFFMTVKHLPDDCEAI